MDESRAADILWEALQKGEFYPPALRGQLDLDTALRVQMRILERRQARGETHAGWKIGLTSPRVRAHFGTDEQPFGYLLLDRVRASATEIRLDEIPAGTGVEPELCFILEEPLRGPGVTPARARSAVRGVLPGMEINEQRSGGIVDFPLAVADNLTQWGIVVGAPIVPVPEGFDSDALRVVMRCNGKVMADVVGRDVIDDHFQSIATLANVLGTYGKSLEPGHHVITGSFSKHDVAAGERWEAEFEGIGGVAVSFV
jgi:2-keto-4-pentenoate hydratase